MNLHILKTIYTCLFGGRVAADVARRLVDETFPVAASQSNVQPVSSPAVEQQRLTRDQPFSYKARVEVIPEVKKVDYDGLTAKRPVTEATDTIRKC